MDVDINTVMFNGITYTLRADPYWDGDDYCFPLTDGTTLCVRNPYPVSLTWDGLDAASSEVCEIELTQRYSNEQYKKNEQR